MKILFLINNKYPNGDAGAIRQHSFAYIFKTLGHEVKILRLNQNESIKQGSFEGIEYSSIQGRYFQTKGQLKKHLANIETPDLIILNTIPFPAFSYAKKYALSKNIKLIHDCVEWFSIDEFSFKNIDLLIRGYLANNLVNRCKLDKKFKIISISSYLEKYFLHKGLKTVRIPVIMDMKRIQFIKRILEEKLNILYAGSPGSKDYLSNVLSALELLSKNERDRINFNILGVNTLELSAIIKKPISYISSLTCVHSHGKVKREVVLEKLKETDFTILIRSDKARYAKAGFPTKVVESLASGTPVILNLTSDLNMYLEDSKDCLVVKSSEPKDILFTLRRALNLTFFEKNSMQTNSRKTAEKYFDTEKYVETMKLFIES